MEQSELLRFLVTALENLNLPYFITGSTVTIFYGEPRFTNDIDVVVDLPGEEVSAFCRRFPDGDFYVSEEAVRDAVARRSQFNIIHPRSGLKIDVMILPPANSTSLVSLAYDGSRPVRTGTRRLRRLRTPSSRSWSVTGRAAPTNICVISPVC